MPITDKQRFDLHAALRRVLGEELGDVMIEHLPPVGWADVALSRDIMAVRGDIDSLRRDVDDLKNDMRILRADMDAFRTEIRGELHRELSSIRSSIRVLTGAMITIAVAMLGVMVQINLSIVQL